MCSNQKTKFKTFSGFTLAEVLITLGIIGIVAAMTIPTLMNNTNNKQNVTAFKEAYSILAQAGKSIAYENGGSLSGVGIYNTNTAQTVFDAFSPYLKFVKNCGISNGNGGCFYDTSRYQLSGGVANANMNSNYSSTNWATVILSNGIAMAFHKGGAGDCVTDRGDGTLTRCGTIEMDVNGVKPPNKIGRDVFGVVVLSNGTVVPSGTYDTPAAVAADCTTSAGGNGWMCSSKVIKEDKENY